MTKERKLTRTIKVATVTALMVDPATRQATEYDLEIPGLPAKEPSKGTRIREAFEAAYPGKKFVMSIKCEMANYLYKMLESEFAHYGTKVKEVTTND